MLSINALINFCGSYALSHGNFWCVLNLTAIHHLNLSNLLNSVVGILQDIECRWLFLFLDIWEAIDHITVVQYHHSSVFIAARQQLGEGFFLWFGKAIIQRKGKHTCHISHLLLFLFTLFNDLFNVIFLLQCLSTYVRFWAFSKLDKNLFRGWPLIIVAEIVA